MMVFYVDEAGCLGTLPTATSPTQPVFALAGIILRRECLKDFTLDWLTLKERFFSSLRAPYFSPFRGPWCHSRAFDALDVASGSENERARGIGKGTTGLSACAKNVAAGILPAVEPGVPPGGCGPASASPVKSRPMPGGRMPPFTASETLAATRLGHFRFFKRALRL